MRKILFLLVSLSTLSITKQFRHVQGRI